MIYLRVGCQCLIGLVFVLSLAGKLRGRGRYAAFVTAAGELAPALPARVVAPLVLAGEALIVATVAVPATSAIGLALAVGLLGAFTVGIVLAIRQRRRVACQCFGSSTTPLGPWHVARNLFLLASAVTGAALALAPPGAAAVSAVGVAVSAVAGAGAAGLTLLTDDLADLFKPID